MEKLKILPFIDSPADVKKLNMEQLKVLAAELRQYILEVVSHNGGHLAPSLGVVELTLALHRSFSTPRDKLIFDVGHQSYVHKIITGRREQFKTLRQYGGLSGFPKISESPHDAFGTGHSSTSISAALGMARARDLQGDDYHVVAVIGDGSLTGGMAFEGLNNVGNSHTRLMVVLNDNEMSIAKNVGALSEYLSAVRTGDVYNRVKNKLADLLKDLDYGENILKAVHRIKGSIKHLIVPSSIFEELGFTYLGPVDGHDLKVLNDVLEGAKKLDGPVLIHVLTKKGKGYAPAEANPAAFHGTGAFDVATGKKLPEKIIAPTYTEVFSGSLVEEGRVHNNLVAITAAMPDGTGLKKFGEVFPKRYFDVGIAEQHAVTMAAGMAVNGLLPVVAVYSSFLQRAYDSVLHDVCNQNLHVVFCLDRAGLVGDDGSTHHGVFDVAFLRSLPNMTLMVPKNENELSSMLHTALVLPGPVAIRYPRGRGWGVPGEKPCLLLPGKAEVLRKGTDGALWVLGSMVAAGSAVAEKLSVAGISLTVVNMRFVKPLDENLLLEHAKKYGRLITLEEGVVAGGAGSAVLEFLARKNLSCRVLNLGIGDFFVPHGKKELLLRDLELDEDSLVRRITAWLKQD